MDFSSICRTCLGVENLNPIFHKNDDRVKVTTAIMNATGIQVRYNDNLPENMCTDCINKLNEVLKFRTQCRESDLSLLLIQTKNKCNVIKKERSKNTQMTIYNPVSQLRGTYSIKSSSNAKIKVELTESISTMGYEETIEASENSATNIRVKKESDLDDLPSNPLLPLNTSYVKETEFDEQFTDSMETVYHISNDHKSEDELDEPEMHSQSEVTIFKNDVDDELKNVSNPSTDLIDDDTELRPYELLTDPTTEKVSRVLCKLCNRKLSIRSIDIHMARKHPGADKRKVKCDLCDTYLMRNKLRRHMTMIHGNECFRCGYCKTEFFNKEELVKHVGICTAKARKRNGNESSRELKECDLCHKVMQKASLRLHKALKHAGLKPVCEHCGKAFGNKFRLKEHYRAKHGYEKFQCKDCDFRSASAMAMRNHERRHRGEKPFGCEECGAKFHAAYLLAQHRHTHRTERAMRCDLCPASFKSNNSLHMHKLTCHSNSNYTCMLCERSYKCRHYALKHLRHVHNETGPSPPLRVVRRGEVIETPS